MMTFFQAISKVQKDRHIIRDTDMRMAKYSRRGLIFNFIAFLICLVGGRFVQENRELTIILATGLLLITFLRGFYLFRFEHLYPRGPARWRNTYFVVTLLGAFWWGVILASITLQLGMQYETPLLWLYTVVFFSTTAHAFAPYHRFLAYYQFFGIMPAAVSAVYLGGQSGYLYGSLMLFFYLILGHQCRLISDNYWEKLEAGYALGRSNASDDIEKNDRLMNTGLSKEFLTNLDQELRLCLDAHDDATNFEEDSAAWNSLSVIQKNVDVFKHVIAGSMVEQQRIFNIRHELQFLVSEVIPFAEKRGIQVETSLSTNLPMRMKGDPKRFAQITRTLLSHIVSESKSTTVIIDVQFLREYESSGELYVTVRRIKNKSIVPFFNDAHEKELLPNSLALTTSKALAEWMGGDIDIVATPENDYSIRFNARLEIADQLGQLDFHKDRFSGKPIMLICSNPAIVDLKRQELGALGFSITTETNLKRVLTALVNMVKSGDPVENILIYHEPENELSSLLMKDLLAAEELKSLNKIIAASPDGREELEYHGLDRKMGFYFVAKPLGLFELESAFDQIYSEKKDDQQLSQCEPGTIIVVNNNNFSASLLEMCKTLPEQKVILVEQSEIKQTLSDKKNCLVVLPCDTESNLDEQLAQIRAYESQTDNNQSFIPIIGVGQNCSESDILAFESGFDDYHDLSLKNGRRLASTLRYWRSLDIT